MTGLDGGVIVILLLKLIFLCRHPLESPLADRLKLNNSSPLNGELIPYKQSSVAGGFFLTTFAKIISGLMGIASAALKEWTMDGAMKIPFKISRTMSNCMIGVTAAVSAVVYLQRGYMDPGITFP